MTHAEEVSLTAAAILIASGPTPRRDPLEHHRRIVSSQAHRRLCPECRLMIEPTVQNVGGVNRLEWVLDTFGPDEVCGVCAWLGGR